MNVLDVYSVHAWCPWKLENTLDPLELELRGLWATMWALETEP